MPQYGLQTNGDLHFFLAQDTDEGIAMHVSDAVTDTIDKAFEETDVIFVTKKPGLAGERVSVLSIKTLNRSMWGRVIDTGAKGGDLFLDVQANQGAATGQFKFTAGGATVVFAKADDAIGTAPVAPAVDALIPVISEEHYN